MKKKIFFTIIMLVLMLSACGKVKNADTNGKIETMIESEVEKQEENIFEAIDTEVNNAQNEEIHETEEGVLEELSCSFTYIEINKIMYAQSDVNVRDLPSIDGNRLGTLSKAQEIVVTGQCNETGWYRIEYANQVAYVSNNYLENSKPEIQPVQDTNLQEQLESVPKPEVIQGTEVTPKPEVEQPEQQPAQPDSNVQFPGPDSDNVLWVDGNSSYEEGLVVVKPRYMYWNNGVLYAECYIVNGCDYTVSGIEVETLSFANDSGEFAWASFGELVDVTIPPYMNIIWTFVYTEDAVIMPNADLNNVYYYSNVYYY